MLRRFLFCAFAALVVTSLSSCETVENLTTLDEQFSTIEESFTYNFPVPYQVVFPNGENVEGLPLNSDQQYEYPIEYYVNGNLGDIIPTNLPGMDRLEEIRITAVDMTVENNSLDTVIQPIELRVGAPGENPAGVTVPGVDVSDFDQAQVAAQSDPLDPGYEGTSAMMIVAENQSAIGTRIADLDFGMGIGSTLLIPQGEPPPGGTATVRFRIEMTAVFRVFGN